MARTPIDRDYPTVDPLLKCSRIPLSDPEIGPGCHPNYLAFGGIWGAD